MESSSERESSSRERIVVRDNSRERVVSESSSSERENEVEREVKTER